MRQFYKKIYILIKIIYVQGLLMGGDPYFFPSLLTTSSRLPHLHLDFHYVTLSFLDTFKFLESSICWSNDYEGIK
jgi:hypothetical protein